MTSKAQIKAGSDATDTHVFQSVAPPRVAEADNRHDQVQHRSLRILVVDDGQYVADALCTMFASWGHQARKCYDGATGLADADQHVPNVVVLDIEMPDMDGYELARRLRISADLHGCYVIAMRSPHDLRGSPRMDSSIDLFLAKPMNLSVLETLLLMESERLDRLT
jgi:two-component system CheB/CheR fusion protein